MRIFFCLELDEEIQAGLARIIGRLQRRITSRVTWVPEENLHVTLNFLGEVDQTNLPRLQSAAEQLLAELSPFTWQLDRLGCFPRPERPRVIWAGAQREPQEIQVLHADLETQLQLLGYPPERGRFTTHVTLGRVKERGPGQAQIAPELERVPAFAYRVNSCGLTLMESRLTPAGAVYRPCFRLAFPNSAQDHGL